MQELYDDIRAAVEKHYDKKLKKSGYSNDQEIWDMIEEFIYDLQDLADDQNRELNRKIEELESDYLPTRTEMINQYDAYKESALA